MTTKQIVLASRPQGSPTLTNFRLEKIDLPGTHVSYHLGILGMTGLTAYFGLMDIGKPKPKETVVVSSAAGAVGMVVGQISSYNEKKDPIGPRPQSALLKKSALMQGFIVGNYASRFSEGAVQLAEWLRTGKLNYRETIIKGFEKLPDAFISLFTGENAGKMLVEID